MSEKSLGGLEYGGGNLSEHVLALPFSVAVFRVAHFRAHRE
jgi:hypothetical protein